MEELAKRLRDADRKAKELYGMGTPLLLEAADYLDGLDDGVAKNITRDEAAARLRELEAENAQIKNDGSFYKESDIDALMARVQKAEAERDSYRAVLEGAGYGDIDGIGKNSVEKSLLLGQTVAQMTMDRMACAEKVEAENARLREVLDVYEDALTEAEAIFGGEYGDQYGPMCEMAFRARDARAALGRVQHAEKLLNTEER